MFECASFIKEGVLKVQLTTVHEEIEELRLQMQIIATGKALTDKRVVGVSEKLDVLINEFYRMYDNIQLRECKG